jgi:hypothetical protein
VGRRSYYSWTAHLISVKRALHREDNTIEVAQLAAGGKKTPKDGCIRKRR